MGTVFWSGFNYRKLKEKKLVLNKNTVANLEDGQMFLVQGGGTTPYTSYCGSECETCRTHGCTTCQYLTCDCGTWCSDCWTLRYCEIRRNTSH